MLEKAIPNAHAGRRARLGRAGALALGISMVALLPAYVAPVLAVTCPDNGSLTNESASPASGTTNTNFTFSVRYQDNLGETPQRVWIRYAAGGPDIMNFCRVRATSRWASPTQERRS